MRAYHEEEIAFAQRLLTDRKSLDDREVEEWLADREHRALLDTAAALRGQLAAPHIHEQEEYQRLTRALKHTRKARRFARWLSAASVACALGLAGYLVLEHRTDNRPLPVASDPTQRPEPRVELILAGGERITLDGTNGVIGSRHESGIRENDTIGLDYSTATVTGQTEVFHTLNVPVGGFYAIQLADSTRVWVNASTSLRYPVAFTGDTRKVYLKGEAYFDVAQSDTHPFIVEANGVEIQVYGTEFNVNAYEPGQVQTVLVEGSVGMRVMSSGREVRLHPEQLAEYRAQEGTIRLEKVDPYRYTAWRNGEFVFEQEPLESILQRLSRWYDIQVFYTADHLKQHCFSGIINRYEEIGDLLRLIEQVAIVRFEIKGNTVVVKAADRVNKSNQ